MTKGPFGNFIFINWLDDRKKGPFLFIADLDYLIWKGPFFPNMVIDTSKMVV